MPAEFIDMMRAEDERYATMSALDIPPQDEDAESELFSLLAAPFLRLLGFLPNAASMINEKLPKLQELVMTGQQPCNAVCAQAMRQCHRLLDDAEAKMDQAVSNASAAAADARANFQVGQAEAAQAKRLHALQLGGEAGGGVE